jgi:hypothetical protein
MLHQDGVVCSACRLAAHYRVPLSPLGHAIRCPTLGILIQPSRQQHTTPGYCTGCLIPGLVSDICLLPHRQSGLDAPGIWIPSLPVPRRPPVTGHTRFPHSSLSRAWCAPLFAHG